jgi:DNA polymerase-3 subunit gamma/tau
LADALAAGRVSGNPRLELETAALRFILQGEDATLEALTQRVAALEGTGAPAPALIKSATAASATQPPAAARAKPANAAAQAKPAAPKPPDTMSAIPADDEAQAKPAHAVVPKPPDAVAPKPVDATPADAAAGVTGPPNLQRVRAMWDQIRTRVYEKANPLRSPLSRATVDSLEDGTVTITIIDPLLEDMVREKQGLIEAAMADLLGAQLRVAIRCSNDRQPAARVARASSAHRAPPSAVAAAPVASAGEPDGEPGLMEYARQKLAGSPSEETQ